VHQSSSADPRLTALQQRLGYSFSNTALLARALTHRSHGPEHNERLEFLGDAVLSQAVSALLYQRLAGSDEGELTRVRAHLVREDSLHRAALALGLPEAMRLSEGEARGGGAQRASILADAVEALIGAVFVDSGNAAAQALVDRLFGSTISSIMNTGHDAQSAGWAKDAKTALQELLQGRRQPVPTYRITATRGQAHLQTFEVECVVAQGAAPQRGEGRSRRAAEQDAAQRMLAMLLPAQPSTNGSSS
jgi:ribonuclease III